MSGDNLYDRFPILRGDPDSANPLTDSVIRVLLGGQNHSPDACSGSVTEEAINRSRAWPIVSAKAPIASFLLANCGRELSNSLCLSEDDLRRLSLEQAARKGADGVADFHRREREHDLSASVANFGGSPIETLLLCGIVDDEGTFNRAFPVSAYWTPRRVAEVVCRSCSVRWCAFCSREHLDRLESFVLVNCGGVTRVLACCWSCESAVRDGAVGHLSWLHAWDSWIHEANWPDESFW